jgi:hypothetical protein
MKHRVVSAILGASMGSAALTTIGLWAVTAWQVDGFSRDAPFAYALYFVYAAIVAAIVASTLGLAWHALATRLGWRSVHAYWPPALFVGVAPPQVIFLPTVLSPNAMYDWTELWIQMSVYGAALGGLTGLFAWLIRRPDRDAANPTTSAP